ncbi:hypothetical protein JG688_00017930, partial [Phytophthora aleatoria]
RIYGNAKDWWNSDLSVDFLNFHFSERERIATTPFCCCGTISPVIGPRGNRVRSSNQG